jgi:hypothetical protein
MKIKSAKSFRFWYKTKVKEIDRYNQTHNENFVGTYHIENGKKIKGFFEMYHGDKPDIAGYLPSILKIAEDGQAIYEFLQNAVDCGSTHFYIFYNEKYFLAINNGSPFDIEGLQSILNIAQTTKKDPDKIGRFGIGFKLAHRLVGKNEGTDELVRQYKGPILFSWAKLDDLECLLKNEKIEPLVPNKENYQEFINSPYLLKLILTNFPADPNEKVKDINYNDKILFPQEELNELVEFLNESFKNHSDSLKKNVLKQGSLFFIKLGEDKKKLLDKDYSELVNGIQYSMNTLKRLQKVYINNDDIGKIPLQLEEGTIKNDSAEFERISPEYKEFDIKFSIGFNTIKFGNEKSYEQIKILKEKPNFYKYFPLGDEINGFGFIVHCDSFSNEANRRKLHEDDINRNLFPELANHITQRLAEYKTKDRSKFLNLYASLLLSDIPDRQNNKWLRPIFYDTLLNSLQKNVPTKNGFSDNAQKVKINKLKLPLNLTDLGLSDIQWFEWDNEADRFLIDEATKSDKLGIKEWDIRDIVENATFENINNWIAICDEETYEAFLDELEESNLRKDTKEKLFEIKLFKFSDNKYYSINDIWTTANIRETFQERTYNQYKRVYEFTTKTRIVQKRVLNQSIIFSTDKTISISNELQNLGFAVSCNNISIYKNIYSALSEKLSKEKDVYNAIAEKCKTNTLSAEEKKKLFLNFVNETTKFDNVAEGTLKDLHLFCDSNSEIKPLNRLVDCKLNTATWLNAYKIKNDEFFAELKPYLVSEQEAIFKEIYLPQQDIILSELTEANEIKSLIKLYQDNKRQFFKEFVIKKTEHSFAIAKKTSNTYQTQAGEQEVRTFIEENCANNLFVLPQEFLTYKEEDGIINKIILHNLILDFVDVDAHKETLVSIIHYDEPKRKFLKKLSDFRFATTATYSKEDYEYKILELVCKELKENEYQIFRNKFIIETAERSFKYSEIPKNRDSIKIATREFSLSKILPSTYQNSNLISDLITYFSQQGISRENLNALFGVNEELDLGDLFEKFSEQSETLQNAEQFFFLIYYHKHIAKVDLSKLNFDFTCAVFPSDFALGIEKLPEYLQEWIKKDEIKTSSLESIGVYTENSTLVSLRKFFLLKSDFNLNTIAKDEKLSDGKMLFNTFELLKEKGIELKTENEFAVFKEMVRVINSSRTKGQELIIQDEFNFEILEKKSTKWKSIGEFSINLYKGALPKIVKLDEIQDYVFYCYNDNDYAVNGRNIYINDNEDKTKTLQKVALDGNNDFTSEDSKDIELSEVKAELEKYKKQGHQNENNTNSSFLEDVNEFISELEKTEWNDFVPELKNILELSVSHPKEKQKLFNLIAKIKLTKENNAKFEDSDEGFNAVKIGNDKYFVHSARGAFAYIHPNEILKMKNEGYKMALDFSTKSRIKIYETAEEILQLNTNHILAYQYEKTLDELFTFCEANRDANKHLLIIDKNNSGEKSRELLKLLNIEDDYQ